MALELKKDYKGYEAKYWRISDYRYDTNHKNCNVTLTLYKNKTLRNESINQSILTHSFNFKFENEEPTIEKLYNLIKEPVMQDVRNELGRFSYVDSDNEPVAEGVRVLKEEDGSYYYVNNEDASKVVVTVLKENVNIFSDAIDC